MLLVLQKFTVYITFAGFSIDASYNHAFGASEVHHQYRIWGFSVNLSYNHAFGALEPQLPFHHQDGTTVLVFPTISCHHLGTKHI